MSDHFNYKQTIDVMDTLPLEDANNIGKTGAITLLYPNNTTVKMEGDPLMIKQLILKLDKAEVVWREIKPTN